MSSTATLDCTKFSKTALKSMLEMPAMAAHHEAIKAFLAPKPKDYTPVEGKEFWAARKSGLATTLYPKGYVRVEVKSGNGCLYAEGLDELIQHLTEVRAKVKGYTGR